MGSVDGGVITEVYPRDGSYLLIQPEREWKVYGVCEQICFCAPAFHEFNLYMARAIAASMEEGPGPWQGWRPKGSEG